MPRSKGRKRGNGRRNATTVTATSAQGINGLTPTIVRPPAEPPQLPLQYTLERTVLFQVNQAAGPTVLNISPVSVVTAIGVDVSAAWILWVHAWSTDLVATAAASPTNQVVLTHQPTGLATADSGTIGNTRGAVGMRLPPYLTPLVPLTSTTALFRVSSFGSTILAQARVVFTTVRASPGIVEL